MDAPPPLPAVDDLRDLLAGIPQQVAIAVSGGPDSMALLRLARDAGLTLTALTVDHGLRAESAGEAETVAGWCAALGIAHETLRWEGPKPRTGLQAKAREARYRLLIGWCRAHGVGDLLIAHSREDQAETVLMRLVRRAPPSALAAMAPLSQRDGVRLHRPLLDVPRARLRAELARLGQPWLSDPSNDDPRFERVRLRRAMPGLDAAGVTVDALVELGRSAAAARDAIAAEARAFLGHHVRHHPQGFAEISRGALAALGGEPALAVLAMLLASYGGGAAERAERQRLLAWLREAGDGAGRRTLGGALIARRRAEILIGREAGRISAVPVAGGAGWWDGRFDLGGLAGFTVIPARDVRGLARDPQLPAAVQHALPAVLAEGRLVRVGGLAFRTPDFALRQP